MVDEKPKPKPPSEDDSIQSALEAVERATGEKLAETPDCETDDSEETDDP